ncbi:hypothetical protein TNIN_130811 [Trichonephila inaurata madagascariensis]|uniref:Uncharacterized protein n=1 Tax=Trichonephila inaurata madagascariensis TaxID=2747483 RepID=A0A8X6IHM0_9ARAC|nr:hypothetical protein TNIN_130811 [Trichonephila inaurata madagascariensis]
MIDLMACNFCQGASKEFFNLEMSSRQNQTAENYLYESSGQPSALSTYLCWTKSSRASPVTPEGRSSIYQLLRDRPHRRDIGETCQEGSTPSSPPQVPVLGFAPRRD